MSITEIVFAISSVQHSQMRVSFLKIELVSQAHLVRFVLLLLEVPVDKGKAFPNSALGFVVECFIGAMAASAVHNAHNLHGNA